MTTSNEVKTMLIAVGALFAVGCSEPFGALLDPTSPDITVDEDCGPDSGPKDDHDDAPDATAGGHTDSGTDSSVIPEETSEDSWWGWSARNVWCSYLSQCDRFPESYYPDGGINPEGVQALNDCTGSPKDAKPCTAEQYTECFVAIHNMVYSNYTQENGYKLTCDEIITTWVPKACFACITPDGE